MRAACIAVLLAAFASSQLMACRGWNVPPLPMEGAAAYEIRATRAEQDHEIVTRYEREKTDLAEARNIYFGVIVSKNAFLAKREYGRPYPNEVVVRPIQAIRGVAPMARQSLVNSYPHRCVVDGNGYAASGQIGELVVIFEGVRTNGLGGMDSILAKDVHTEHLVGALANYIAETDGGPYRVSEEGLTTERQVDGSFKPSKISDPFGQNDPR